MEQLVHVNVMFATTISSIQHVVNTGLNDLMNKVASDLGFKDPLTDYVTVSLIPPVTLVLQLVEASITSVTNIQRVLMESPQFKNADITYLLEKFVPYNLRRLIVILIRKFREFSECLKNKIYFKIILS
ncbi:MAG: hypothetical protein H7836_04695 [Magnetococcus sp. YQC-3]